MKNDKRKAENKKDDQGIVSNLLDSVADIIGTVFDSPSYDGGSSYDSGSSDCSSSCDCGSD